MLGTSNFVDKKTDEEANKDHSVEEGECIFDSFPCCPLIILGTSLWEQVDQSDREEDSTSETVHEREGCFTCATRSQHSWNESNVGDEKVHKDENYFECFYLRPSQSAMSMAMVIVMGVTVITICVHVTMIVVM